MLMKQSQVVAVLHGNHTIPRRGMETIGSADVLSGRRFVRTDLDVLSVPPYTLCQEDVLAGPSLSFFLFKVCSFLLPHSDL